MYPGKVFEYFGARRPILCVPGDDGLLNDLIKSTRTGASCETPEQVASFLLDAFGYWRKHGRVAYEPDEQAVAAYSRSAQSRRMASILDGVVAAEKTE